MKRFRSSTRIRIAAIAFSAVALVLSATPAAGAAGLTNCIEITGPAAGLRGCWENVWVDGVEYRMTFFGGTKPFKGSVPPENLGSFYVIGPQTDTPQSLDHPFMHDHVVAAVPRHNGGEYTPIYQGILVSAASRRSPVARACRLSARSPADRPSLSDDRQRPAADIGRGCRGSRSRRPRHAGPGRPSHRRDQRQVGDHLQTHLLGASTRR